MAAKKSASKKKTAAKKPLTKSEILSHIMEETGYTRNEVQVVFDSLNGLIAQQMKPRAAGIFTIPGLMKIKVVKKAATKARKGTNPFTGEEMMFKAKPARRIVKITPLKGLKDML